MYFIKTRVTALGRSCKELHEEVRRRGEDINQPNFSKAINGKLDRPQGDRVRILADKILVDWETATKGK